MPRPVPLVFIAAAVFLPLGALTRDWVLTTVSALILLAAFIAIGHERLSRRGHTDGPQVPLDDRAPLPGKAARPKRNAKGI